MKLIEAEGNLTVTIHAVLKSELWEMVLAMFQMTGILYRSSWTMAPYVT